MTDTDVPGGTTTPGRIRRRIPVAVRVSEALAAGVAPAVLARLLGRPEPWVRGHARLVSPGVRALFLSGRLASIDDWDRFLQLPPVARRRLLDGGGAITVARCTRSRRACPDPRRSGYSGAI